MNRLDAMPEPDTAPAQPTSGSIRPAATLVRLGSLPSSSTHDLRLIQDRIALFFETVFFITAMFLVATTALDYWLRDGQSPASPSNGRVSHGLATALALGLWRVTKSRRQFSPATLQLVDAGGTIGVCSAFAVMGYYFEQPYGFYTALLAIIHVNVGRAALLPSLPGRSFVISLVSFSALVFSRSMLPAAPGQTIALFVRGLAEALLWSMAGSGVATLCSRVIYGLHEEAIEARRLGQYELEKKIGQGGMGEIYRARHAMLRRPTAVKLLSGHGSEEQLRRFEKEVQLTARLTHPNTISIYDYGRTPEGTFYYAMELLLGLTVEQLVERHGPAPVARVIHILMQVCGALSEAHGIGLIHRDIKPANVYLCRRGGVPDVVKVLDFGLVRELDSGADATASSADVVVGTPLYMSPEAILSPDRIDARADLYGVGGVAYYLLTGSPPFNGKSLVEVCSHHLHTAPTPPSHRRPVPEDLERLVLSCLAKDPGERPASAAALAEALTACEGWGAWTHADAERWWAEVEHEPTPHVEPAASGEQPRKTIVAADIAQRLARRV